MKKTILLGLAAILWIATALAIQAQDRPQETMIDERFDVGAGGALFIEVGDADVEVETGASDGVHVEVILQARNRERGREYFERQRYSVEQRGDAVYVETDPERNQRWNWRDWRDHPHLIVRVQIPERFDVDLRTADGDVRLGRLRGDARLRTSDGDVMTDAIDGATVEIHTSDGELDLGAIIARTVIARTSDGDVRLRNVQADDAEVRTSDGDIRVEMFDGAAFSARTSDGEIHVEALHARTSTLRTSDGVITVRNARGDLTVSGSSGDIRLDLVDPGAVSATTSDGDISITLPTGHRADLRLRGDEIRIATSLDFNGRLEKDRAEGALHGGGPLIEARTSDGDVTLRGQ